MKERVALMWKVNEMITDLLLKLVFLAALPIKFNKKFLLVIGFMIFQNGNMNLT